MHPRVGVLKTSSRFVIGGDECARRRDHMARTNPATVLALAARPIPMRLLVCTLIEGRNSLRVAACCASLLWGAVCAQPAEVAEVVENAPPSVSDEIVVIGKSPRQLRVEMERAEVAVYDRFNAVNSDDEFDIHCWREEPTGSRITRRVCQANFWREAQARAAREVMAQIRGGTAMDPAIFLAEGASKMGLLREELKRVAAADEEFQRSLAHFVSLKRALEGVMRTPLRTTSVERSNEKAALPFGAALAANVQIGHRPWRHPLTERTFTFAQLQGEVSGLQVVCAGQAERLEYVESAEWTLPTDWQRCDLRVDAPRGTTFTLYEFE
jgi:hypothetical protein